MAEVIPPSDVGEREELWASVALLSSPPRSAVGARGYKDLPEEMGGLRSRSLSETKSVSCSSDIAHGNVNDSDPQGERLYSRSQSLSPLPELGHFDHTLSRKAGATSSRHTSHVAHSLGSLGSRVSPPNGEDGPKEAEPSPLSQDRNHLDEALNNDSAASTQITEIKTQLEPLVELTANQLAEHGARVLRKRELRQKQPYTYEMAHYKATMRHHGNEDAIVSTHRLSAMSPAHSPDLLRATSSSSEAEEAQEVFLSRRTLNLLRDDTDSDAGCSSGESLTRSSTNLSSQRPTRKLRAPHQESTSPRSSAMAQSEALAGAQESRLSMSRRTPSSHTSGAIHISSSSEDSSASESHARSEEESAESEQAQGIGPVDSRRFRKALHRTLPRIAHAKVYEDIKTRSEKSSLTLAKPQNTKIDQIGLAKRKKITKSAPLDFRLFHGSDDSSGSSENDTPEAWLDQHPWRPNEASIFTNKPFWPQRRSSEATDPDPIDRMLAKGANNRSGHITTTKRRQRRVSPSKNPKQRPGRETGQQQLYTLPGFGAARLPLSASSANRWHGYTAYQERSRHPPALSSAKGVKALEEVQITLKEDFPAYASGAADIWAKARKPRNDLAKICAEHQKRVAESDLSYLRSGQLSDLLNIVNRSEDAAPREDFNSALHYRLASSDQVIFDTRLESLSQAFATILDGIRAEELCVVKESWQSVKFLIHSWSGSSDMTGTSTLAALLDQELVQMERIMKVEQLPNSACVIWHEWYAIAALIYCRASKINVTEWLTRLVERMHLLSGPLIRQDQLYNSVIVQLWPCVIHLARSLCFDLLSRLLPSASHNEPSKGLESDVGQIFSSISFLTFVSACALISVHGNSGSESALDPDGSWRCLDRIFQTLLNVLTRESPRTLLGNRRRSQYLEFAVGLYRSAVLAFGWTKGFHSFKMLHDCLETRAVQEMARLNWSATEWLDMTNREVGSASSDITHPSENVYHLFLKFIIAVCRMTPAASALDYQGPVRSLNRLLPTRRFTTAANEIPLLIYNYSLIMVYIAQSTLSVDLISKFQHVTSLVAFKQADTYTRQISIQAIRHLGALILARNESLHCIAIWANNVSSDLLEGGPAGENGAHSAGTAIRKGQVLEMMMLLRAITSISRMCPEEKKHMAAHILDQWICALLGSTMMLDPHVAAECFSLFHAILPAYNHKSSDYVVLRARVSELDIIRCFYDFMRRLSTLHDCGGRTLCMARNGVKENETNYDVFVVNVADCWASLTTTACSYEGLGTAHWNEFLGPQTAYTYHRLQCAQMRRHCAAKLCESMLATCWPTPESQIKFFYETFFVCGLLDQDYDLFWSLDCKLEHVFPTLHPAKMTDLRNASGPEVACRRIRECFETMDDYVSYESQSVFSVVDLRELCEKVAHLLIQCIREDNATSTAVAQMLDSRVFKAYLPSQTIAYLSATT